MRGAIHCTREALLAIQPDTPLLECVAAAIREAPNEDLMWLEFARRWGGGAKNVLELGTQRGEMAWLLSHACAAGTKIVTVDLGSSDLGNLQDLAAPGREIIQIIGNSHDQTTLDEVRTIFGDESVDILLIDADHTCDSVKQDFAMYAPLVKRNRIIAFHDVGTFNAPGSAWDQMTGHWGVHFLLTPFASLGFGISIVPLEGLNIEGQMRQGGESNG